MAEKACALSITLHAHREFLAEDGIREGSFQSVRELVEAIDEYLTERNENPKRYLWRAKGEQILQKIQRAKKKLTHIING